jgi:iron complex outermembrane receptor protein
LGRAAFALTASSLTLTGMNAQTPADSATPVTNANPPASADQATKMEAFTVTGSYLPVSASASASPIVTIQSSAIGATGATDPLRLLRELTPFFSGNGNVGTEANNGAGGESNVALRNLTTLVLINGQRVVSSPFSNGTAVDLNTIPTAMIDHIDILKDGASTVYGTDAIGGVVNVVLKKDYNGFEVGARWGQTANADYRTKDIYVIGGAAGTGFSLTLAAEHYTNNTLKTTSRSIATLTPAQEKAMGFLPTSSVFSGSYPGRVGNDVLAGSTLIAIGSPGFNAATTSPGIKSSPSATPVTLAQLEASGVYLPVAAKTLAGQAVGSATALNTTLFGNPLIVPTRRSQFVMNGEKDLFSKSLTFYSDFLYANTINSGATLAPAPIAGVGPAGANTLTIPANNPYNVFSVPFPGPLSARTRTIELGPRTSNIETNTFRIVTGLKGTISENYSWDVSYQYSKASMVDRTLGGGNGANLNSAMIPLLNSSGGYVYNAAGKPLSILTDSAGNNLPVYNFFALPGFNDPATVAAIRTTLFDTAATGLHDVRAIFRGTPFELPGGNLSFDVGLEERSESISSSVDGLYSNGLALGFNTKATFAGGSRSSKAVFAEVDVPLVSPKMAMPGVHVLDLQLGERYEKIKPGGNATSPKIELRYLPFDDQLAFRATAAKGFIAPSIFDLFGPSAGNSPTFNILQGDPKLTTGQAGGSLTTKTTIQGTATELSNPGLQASKSNSFTAGIVYSPKQVRGLTLSVDYYKISEDKIGTLDYTAIATDLNARGSASKYAPGFLFADSSSLASTAPNQVNALNFGSIAVQKNPSGNQYTNGVDIAVDYVMTSDYAGRWGAGASTNILFNYVARATGSAPYYQYARNFTDQTTSIGNTNGLLPGYILKAYLSNVYGPLTTSAFFSFVPRTTVSGSLFGDFTPGDINDETVSGKAYTIPSYFTADFSVSYAIPSFGHQWMRNAVLTVGANNVFNKHPPYVPVDGNPPGENNTVESTYDIIGRFYFVELKKSF